MRDSCPEMPGCPSLFRTLFINDLMYCDASFGPALVRQEFSSKYAEKFRLRQDLLLEFIINENLRIIHCPDCLFHSNVAELKGSGKMF